MSQILGTLLDSAGNPLTGKLRVSLTGTLVNDIDNPDSIFLSDPYLFTITSGVLDIDLQESETSKVTYRFEFFKTDGEDELIEPALLDFYALVPNLSPIQFASLVPTGMVNDVLDTGALRVARIIASNPNLASNIGGPFPKGEWSPSTTYNYRDLVTYLNRTYICKSISPITGVYPTDTSKWMNIPVEPNGELILGDDTPYGVAWNGSGLATSQNAVYDAIQTINTSISAKANIDSPIFTGNVIVPNQTAGSNNTRAANTAYVDAGLALKADLDSPTFTGDLKAPNRPDFDNDTSIANTAFVQRICRPAFMAIMSSTQSHTTDNTRVNFAAEEFDTNGTWVTHTFTAPVTGIYLFGGSVYIVNDDSSSRVFGVEVMRDGIGYMRVGEVIISPAAGLHISFSSTMIYLTAGQTVSVQVRTFGLTYPYRIIHNMGSGYFWGFRIPI